MHTHTTVNPARHFFAGTLAKVAMFICIANCAASLAHAQEVIYQEGFNDDGSKANPPRYTITGGSHFEVSEFNTDNGVPTTQLGPVYWAHNFEVSFVGVPGPTPARRALLAWDAAITADELTEVSYGDET